MKSADLIDEQFAYADDEPAKAKPTPDKAFELDRLLQARPSGLSSSALPQVIIGELLAIADDGKSPLVIYPGQPGTAALRARSVLDLHGAHIGQSVVLQFEGGDPALPIVMGVLREIHSQPLVAPGKVEVDADGQRMIVSAKDQIVLRCGKSSITLTESGHVEIRGEVIVSQAVKANRIRGGSVEMN